MSGSVRSGFLARRGCLAAVAILMTLALFTLAVPWQLSGRLAAPHRGAVGAMPTDLPLQPVTIAGASGSHLAGWFVPGTAVQGGVVLLHGLRSSRWGMLGRARFLHQAGYSVLLVDFQAHGDSPGRYITFGHLESRDAEAAVAWLQARMPGRPIGVIGVSLGGAAVLLGEAKHRVQGLVLESVYTRFSVAVANRIAIRLGPAGRWLAPLLTWQVRPRLGFDPDRLAPVEQIGTVAAPKLIIAGSRDRHTTPADTHRLYRAASPPKDLWIVPGAGHGNLHAHAPEAYRRRVLAFLDAVLVTPGQGRD